MSADAIRALRVEIKALRLRVRALESRNQPRTHRAGPRAITWMDGASLRGARRLAGWSAAQVGLGLGLGESCINKAELCLSAITEQRALDIVEMFAGQGAAPPTMLEHPVLLASLRGE